MDICILYFSGTGNTWWASNKLAEELMNKGRTVEVHSIELLTTEKTAELIEDTETIIFGYPSYGSCMPEPMKYFIDNLHESVKSKNAGIFCTHASYSGDGAWYYHKKLEEKGFLIKWTYHFNLPSNLSITISPFPYTDDSVKISKIFKKCVKKLEKAAEDISLGTSSLTGNSFGSLLLGLFQRPVYKLMYKPPFKCPYKTIHSKCTKCMRCIQICPEGNIKLVDGEITFGRKCAMCLRCYNFCPVSAITAHGHKHKEGVKTYRGPDDFDPALITKRKDLLDFIE